MSTTSLAFTLPSPTTHPKYFKDEYDTYSSMMGSLGIACFTNNGDLVDHVKAEDIIILFENGESCVMVDHPLYKELSDEWSTGSIWSFMDPSRLMPSNKEFNAILDDIAVARHFIAEAGEVLPTN